MPRDLDLLTQIHDDTQYMREKLDTHIERDDKIMDTVIRPLWEAHQQAKGIARFAGLVWGAVGGTVIGIVDYLVQAAQHLPMPH